MLLRLFVRCRLLVSESDLHAVTSQGDTPPAGWRDSNAGSPCLDWRLPSAALFRGRLPALLLRGRPKLRSCPVVAWISPLARPASRASRATLEYRRQPTRPLCEMDIQWSVMLRYLPWLACFASLPKACKTLVLRIHIYDRISWFAPSSSSSHIIPLSSFVRTSTQPYVWSSA